MAPENQAHTVPLESTYASLPATMEPSVGFGREREPPIVGPNDPIEVKENASTFSYMYLRNPIVDSNVLLLFNSTSLTAHFSCYIQ